MEFKSSFYNRFYKIKNVSLEDTEVSWLIYNTRTSAILKADKELKTIVENGDLSQIPTELIDILSKTGVIVNKKLDERDLIRHNYLKTINDTTKAHFVIVLTYDCILKCPYCYEGASDTYSGYMDQHMAEKVVLAIQKKVVNDNSKQLEITFFGGEPLLNIPIAEFIIQEIKQWVIKKKIDVKFSIVTNGLLINDKKESFKSLLPHIDLVRITIDGPKTIHDKKRITRSGKGTFNRIISGIKTLKENNIRISIRIQVARDNMDLIPRLIEELISEGVITSAISDPLVKLDFAPLFEMSNLCGSYDGYLNRQEALQVAKTIAEYNTTAIPGPQLIPCLVYGNLFAIDPFGDVYKCLSMLGEKNHRVGFINNSNEILFEFEMMDFMSRDPLKITPCKECIYLPMCGGSCPRTSQLKKGTYHNSVCGVTQEVIETNIRHHLQAKFPQYQME